MNDEFGKRNKFIEPQFIKKIELHSYFQIKQIPSFLKFFIHLKSLYFKKQRPPQYFHQN
jgi:hypothetical protein